MPRFFVDRQPENGLLVLWGERLISLGARRILYKLPRTRFENAPKLVESPDWPEAARLFRQYTQQRMQIPEKFLPPLVSAQEAAGI